MSEACLWRISQFEDLSGIGGTMVPGRWHNKGRPVVYLGDCPALCLLEILVHLEGAADELPEAFTLLRVALPSAEVERSPTADLSATWREDVNGTRQIGDSWLEAGESLLLRVPSAIVPHNMNFLFNPLHSAASQVELSSESFPADHRLYPPPLVVEASWLGVGQGAAIRNHLPQEETVPMSYPFRPGCLAVATARRGFPTPIAVEPRWVLPGGRHPGSG